MLSITEDEIRYYKQLDEKQRRLYLGLRTKQEGRHGVKLVSEAYGVDIKTVRKGKAELIELPEMADKRQRKKGGGPKKN